ncbi:hypothetical protein [Hymenobacter pini]|uniref:hypothetical protein n=1 Tax=Hymenobacter pini TaxID=2880879 RepID=UPI001CF3B562|nr:hypothetical protein [Hymenobacter pini]MCA8830502.1 hypothetical protein [Hymenobacter pini]
MSQETISQRLSILIKALGLNPRSFSEKFGVNEGTTRGYTTRGSVPNADYIATLLRAIEHLNPAWLLLGRGEMFLDGSAEVQVVDAKRGGALAELEKELATVRRENEQLKALIAAKDDLIAAKEEVLTLLRSSKNLRS